MNFHPIKKFTENILLGNHQEPRKDSLLVLLEDPEGFAFFFTPYKMLQRNPRLYTQNCRRNFQKRERERE